MRVEIFRNERRFQWCITQAYSIRDCRILGVNRRPYGWICFFLKHLYLLFFQSQSIAEILLLPLLENKQTPFGNSTSGFGFQLLIVIYMWFCTDVPNFIRIGRSATELWPFRFVDFPRWRPYGGHTVANLLPLSGFMTSRIEEDKKLLAYQISTKYLHSNTYTETLKVKS